MKPSLAERASFRDPAGRMVERDGQLRRLIAPDFVPTFRAVERSGLYDALQSAELLVSHAEVSSAQGEALTLRPERVPLISYPYEWTPVQLADAALLTLDVADQALRRGQMLRDASAFNVQFLRGRPILIDSLSFAPRAPGSPWLAYGQFCRHFLAPLTLATLVEPEMLRLAELQSDGIPTPVASDVLGRRGWWRAGVAVHLHLHAVAERRATRTTVSRNVTVSDRRLAQLIDGLRSTISALPLKPRRTRWMSYAGGSHYDEVARASKEAFVASAVDRVRPDSLWDLGANQGELAHRHVPKGGYSLALDADLGCVESCYASAHRDRRSVVALWRDLLAPTPSTGWSGEERASLIERGPADLVLALALVHHLCIAGQVPLARVASWLSRIARFAVVEVPDRDDPMVKQLSQRAPVQATRFGRDEFRVAIAPHFEILEELHLTGLPRSLFLLRRRSA